MSDHSLLMAILAVACLTSWVLGVAWERIAANAWRRRADHWFDRAMTLEGDVERLRRPVAARDHPRPMSCPPVAFRWQCGCPVCTARAADDLIRSIPGCRPPVGAESAS